MVHFSVWVDSDLNSEDKSYIILLVSSNICLFKTYTLFQKEFLVAWNDMVTPYLYL